MSTLIVVGGSDGIGLELTALLRRDFDRVLVAGLDASMPGALSESVEYRRADLASDNGAERFYSAARQWLGEDSVLDMMVYCAGMGWVCELTEQPTENVTAMYHVNTQSALRLVHGLRPRRTVLLGSTSVMIPTPAYAVYTATKAALESFTMSLAAEAEQEILCIHPGPTRTRFHERAGFRGATAGFRSPAQTAGEIAAHIKAGGSGVRLCGSPAWRLVRIAHRLCPQVLDALMRLAVARSLPAMCARRRYEPSGWVVTGATRGIGRAVVADARRRWPGTDGVGLGRAQGDLATESGVSAVAARLREVEPGAVVVLNAGVNVSGPFHDVPWATHAEVLRTNLLAPMLLAQAVPPGADSVVFVSSLAALVGYPFSAVYGASKAGLASFGRSLNAVRPTVTVFPGPTDTDQARENSPVPDRPRMAPGIVARATWDAVAARRPAVITGWMGYIMAWLAALLPWVVLRMMRKALRPRK